MMDSMRRVTVPDAEEAKKFWQGIWGEESKMHESKCRMVHEIQRRSPGKGEPG